METLTVPEFPLSTSRLIARRLHYQILNLILCSKIGPKDAHKALHKEGPIIEQIIRFFLLFSTYFSVGYYVSYTWSVNLQKLHLKL